MPVLIRYGSAEKMMRANPRQDIVLMANIALTIFYRFPVQSARRGKGGSFH
jgi:hypothetical protein